MYRTARADAMRKCRKETGLSFRKIAKKFGVQNSTAWRNAGRNNLRVKDDRQKEEYQGLLAMYAVAKARIAREQREKKASIRLEEKKKEVPVEEGRGTGVGNEEREK